MRVRVSIYHNNGFPDNHAEIEVPELIERNFEPVDFCSDSLMAATSSNGVHQSKIKEVAKIREDSAEKLSEYIAILLVEEMRKNDTFNGYKK